MGQVNCQCQQELLRESDSFKDNNKKQINNRHSNIVETQTSQVYSRVIFENGQINFDIILREGQKITFGTTSDSLQKPIFNNNNCYKMQLKLINRHLTVKDCGVGYGVFLMKKKVVIKSDGLQTLISLGDNFLMLRILPNQNINYCLYGIDSQEKGSINGKVQHSIAIGQERLVLKRQKQGCEYSIRRDNRSWLCILLTEERRVRIGDILRLGVEYCRLQSIISRQELRIFSGSLVIISSVIFGIKEIQMWGVDLSMNVGIQQVRPGNLYRLRDEYMCNFADSINCVAYKQGYSRDCILTEDVLCLVEDVERVKTYINYNEQAYKQFIQLMGQYYERSTSERKTEIPLMFLTDTETILVRRIKRLKKLDKQKLLSYNQSSFSQQETSYIDYMPNSRNQYLQSHLSAKSFLSLADSSSSEVSVYSNYNIFKNQSSGQVEGLIEYLDQITDRSKGREFWKRQKNGSEDSLGQLVCVIKTPTESELEHLIYKGSQGSSTDRSQNKKQDENTLICRSCGQCKLCIKLHSNRLSEQPSERLSILTKKYYHQIGTLPSEVISGVSNQLQRYSFGSTPISSSLRSNGKKTIREKAVEMLRQLGMPIRK